MRSLKLDDMPAVAPGQKQTLAYDLGAKLPTGVMPVDANATATLAGTLSVHFGNDASPADHVTAGPTIGTVALADGGSGVAGMAILFQLYQLLDGVTYVYSATVPLSDGDVWVVWARIPCVAPS